MGRLTLPYYVYRVVFTGATAIPSLRPDSWLRQFPYIPGREIWVKHRRVRDLLLNVDPGATWEKHEARHCGRCGRWFLGLQAQIVRDRQQRGEETCSDSCNRR